MSAQRTTYPPRLRGLIAIVLLIAGALVAGATCAIVWERPGLAVLGQASVFLALAFLADLKPVPLDETGSRSVSLAFVFVLAAQMLFGWEYSIVIGSVCVLMPQVLARSEPTRALFNSGVYAIAALVSAAPSLLLDPAPGAHPLAIAAYAIVAGALFVLTNVVLVCLAVAFYQHSPLVSLLYDNFRNAGMAFLTMVFLVPLAVVLWRLDMTLLALLAGPLVTLTLYQSSALASRIAVRHAHTDSLTGLGNHRAYELELAGAIARSNETDQPVSLCFLDVDEFKRLNDAFGHPVGDAGLEMLGALLSRGGDAVRAFRLGGDEFALVVDGPPDVAEALVRRVQRELAEKPLEGAHLITISAGIASAPRNARAADDLERVVDASLYWAKEHGKDRICSFDPTVVRLRSVEEQVREAERSSRLRAAENLIQIVDAKDTYTGTHSQSVSTLCVALAKEVGLDDESVELVRLAGLLHDLGKILIPDELLRKPSALSEDETQLMRGHPELGYSLLANLDVAPVDTWVRHHHEHWDGSGYPHGLAGREIPLASRILLVADAFDAITTERSYQRALGSTEALAELRAGAGSQFDPLVVAALEQHLGCTTAVPVPSRPAERLELVA